MRANPLKYTQVAESGNTAMTLSTHVLSKLMRFAVDKAEAERALACDRNLAVVDMLNLDAASLDSEGLRKHLEQALSTGQVVVGNNAIPDPNNAPTTNTRFDHLRGIVVIPLGETGVLYLDRPVKKGIIPREVSERISRMASHCTEDTAESQMETLYLNQF
jgi:hypothetical protein